MDRGTKSCTCPTVAAALDVVPAIVESTTKTGPKDYLEEKEKEIDGLNDGFRMKSLVLSVVRW